MEAGEISGEDRVLEIGPGTGILTFRLAERAEEVYAIEIEPALASHLRNKAKKRGVQNLKVIQGDALRAELPGFDKVVSNLPYSIASPLTFRLLPMEFKTAILMYQAEFALRLIASPGTKERGALTLRAQYYADIEGLFPVSRENFYPVPEVDSVVVQMKKRPFPYPLKDPGFYLKLIGVIFMHRRRKLRNSLHLGYMNLPFTEGMKKQDFRAILEDSVKEEVLEKRAEELEVEEVVEMANSLYSGLQCEERMEKM